ncbi:hypothetical protein ONE63_002715 [Megalurothrips usitatus]|uniref:Beta-lactamase-related domain-containing protein n=1 Tax=Megalurothrips usitatus TaxID=439358 RepID=A0AAV7X9C6_9NEOP|nr:hypothetical protein ONE63_002715 [Megalurothrips usitatus]
MSQFGRHFWTVSGVMGGFSAGAAASVLLLKPSAAAPAAPAAPAPAPADQLFTSDQGRVPAREFPAPATASAAPVTHGSVYDSAIRTCRELANLTKEEVGIPGLCVAVSVNGETVWTEGFGYADVENGVPCTPKTVMRIASISKPLTMAALAKLWESGKVDLDLPVQHFVPSFPDKTFEGKPVEITTRMLVSHLSGIRHWKGGEEKEPDPSTKPEFYLNTRFKSVEDALTIFQNDELCHRPGTTYLYSSPAWTLISAVMEKAAGAPYHVIMTNMCNQLGLRNTKLDLNEKITPGRARYYSRNKHGRLINSPCVDNSCKWAGGGLQSTVGDLVKFGDAMLYCHQGGPSGYLKKATIDTLWTVSPNTMKEPQSLGYFSGYGMGWAVTPALVYYGGVEPQAFSVNHSGGAVGASSILLVNPKQPSDSLPAGVTVAITVNLQGVGLLHLARNIAHYFWDAKCQAAST